MKHRDHAVLLTPPLRNNRSVQASTKTEKAQPDTGAPSRARHTGKTQTSSPGVESPPRRRETHFLAPGKGKPYLLSEALATGLGDKRRDEGVGGGRRCARIPLGTPARTLVGVITSLGTRCLAHTGQDRARGPPPGHMALEGPVARMPEAKKQRMEHPSSRKAPWGSGWATEPQPGASENSQGALELTSYGVGAVPPHPAPASAEQQEMGCFCYDLATNPG